MINKKGEVVSLNQQFLAAYIMKTEQLINTEGLTWQYRQKTGLWKVLSTPELKNLIATSARQFAAIMGYSISTKMNAHTCNAIQEFMEPSTNNPFMNRKYNVIHVANGMLEIKPDGQLELHPFDPSYYSRNRCEIEYQPDANCTRFLTELLATALNPEDIDLLQRYCGQCLLVDNFTQTFLVLTGTAGGGKGTIVNLVQRVIGSVNCVEIRTNHLGERFELGRFINKTLLIGSDVPSGFLLGKNAGVIKSLCGHDTLTAEIKGVQEGVDLKGRFNLIITANDKLRMNIDGDADAWKRRVLWIIFNKPPVAEPIPNFDDILLHEEGPGILSWMIEGAVKIIQHKFEGLSDSLSRVDELLRESDSVYGFLTECVVRDSEAKTPAWVLVDHYERWCKEQDWVPVPQPKSNAQMRAGIAKLFNITQSNDIEFGSCTRRGYHGIRIDMSGAARRE